MEHEKGERGQGRDARTRARTTKPTARDPAVRVSMMSKQKGMGLNVEENQATNIRMAMKVSGHAFSGDQSNPLPQRGSHTDARV